MKILNAIHAQGIGGVDRVFQNYAEVLTKNGHDVALLISDNGNDSYDFPKVFKLKNISQILDCLKLLWILLIFRPDIVICHSNRLMKWMRILGKFSKAKSVAVNHGISFKNSLNCDYVISINQQISDMVANAGFNKEKSLVLPNVIKIDREFRKRSLKNPPKIGIYGRIEPRKGFDVLIKACGVLAKNGHDFSLKIGGFEVPGSYNLQTIKDFAMEEGILDKCDFVGTVLDKDKFFDDVDIFCVPSREEPFGLVILEGMLYSTLVISSNTDGGKLLIDDEKTGFLFENEDCNDLARKVEKILTNPENYAKITEYAFEKLNEKFSFSFLERKMENILSRISNK